jgi:hypothetical protein
LTNPDVVRLHTYRSVVQTPTHIETYRWRRSVLSVGELMLLFHGDEDSRPYPHVNLVVAICEQCHPASAHQLFCVMYGVPEEGPASGELVTELDEHVVRTIDAGFHVWTLREQPQAA